MSELTVRDLVGLDLILRELSNKPPSERLSLLVEAYLSHSLMDSMTVEQLSSLTGVEGCKVEACLDSLVSRHRILRDGNSYRPLKYDFASDVLNSIKSRDGTTLIYLCRKFSKVRRLDIKYVLGTLLSRGDITESEDHVYR